MTDSLYQYHTASVLERRSGVQNLVLAHQCEIEEVNNIPCFFWGNLTEPYLTAKCWCTLAKVVRSSFAPAPPVLRDPIITAGAERMRFEGFSSCNGVYARLDMKPEAIDGEFVASGTTNVDFNEPMLNALNAIQKNDRVTLAVGLQSMQVITAAEKITERKVTLPLRWIKGLASVQLYLADMSLKFELSRLQAIQLFQSLPKGKIENDFYITNRMGKFLFATMATKDSVRVGGIQRLRLLEGILPLADKLYLYESADRETCAVICELGKMQLLMAFSPDNYRGFSGEGKVLDVITQNLPPEYVSAVGNLFKSNETFSPTLLAVENDIAPNAMDNITAGLSSMGLLGYDIEAQSHFYRRLPFKTERILSLNPRLKNAQKLIDEADVHITVQKNDYIEALVKGSGVTHKVVIENDAARCTCNWFSNYQGKRGVCKHILATKMAIAK